MDVHNRKSADGEDDKRLRLVWSHVCQPQPRYIYHIDSTQQQKPTGALPGELFAVRKVIDDASFYQTST